MLTPKKISRRRFLLSGVAVAGAMVVGWGVMPPRQRVRGTAALPLENGAVALNGWIAIAPDGSDIPAFNVFTRRDGVIRHFWSGEMGSESADPGQDPRGAPDLMPLWTILDSTPEGRHPTWYPKLEYGE